ncbi:MAG TPA: YegP family protein [Bacteroidia bacterium]|nr:YegP family protein [Bacteroidia bacterium]
MGTFEIIKRTNGEFQFNLKSGNGQIILTSEGYTTKAKCENGIESVRISSQDDSLFFRQISSNDKQFFNLKASNGQIVGTSQMYETTAAMVNGIVSVKTNAKEARIVDQTAIVEKV